VEADAPLIVDPDTVLPGSISPQSFKPVAGRNSKVGQSFSLV
jgi:hypothetical protein